MEKIPIAIAPGDGIGPEILESVLSLFEACECPIITHRVEIGERAYQKGFLDGIDPKALDIIKMCKAFLKAPLTTKQGGGFKSVNVAMRNFLDLYANVRPCMSYFPSIHTKHPGMDLVIIRENQEDLYCAVEYQQSFQVTKAHKIISEIATQKIIHYAFGYAMHNKRKKVTCMTKDNILKLSDGLFHKLFIEISKQYPDILSEHLLIDIGAAKLATEPELFDVIVLSNLYGDILSDISAQMSGSIGICGSANIGPKYAMFEAIHGSALSHMGKNDANPSGLIMAAIQMLVHLGLYPYAEAIHNSWLKTIEEGVHTQDIYHEKISKKKVSTTEFTKAVLANLGKQPQILNSVSYTTPSKSDATHFFPTLTDKKRQLVGIDITIYSPNGPLSFFDKISHINEGPLHLVQIFNKGREVWPKNMAGTNLADQWVCRFLSIDNLRIAQSTTLRILQDIERIQLEILSIDHLYLLDGEKKF